jgi:hypothetical protein
MSLRSLRADARSCPILKLYRVSKAWSRLGASVAGLRFFGRAPLVLSARFLIAQKMRSLAFYKVAQPQKFKYLLHTTASFYVSS